MKSKIAVNIDVELLDIIRNVSDSDLDSIIQDAISQFLGVKQIWVRSDTLDPISSILSSTPSSTLISTIPKKETPIESSSPKENSTVETNIDTTKRRRQPKFVLKIWDKLKEELREEFTTYEYWDATKKSGFTYKDSARHSTIPEHLKLIEEAGKIIKINERPGKYRKLDIEESSESKLSGDEKNNER